MSSGESWINDSDKRIRHENLQKRVIGFVTMLGSDIISLDKKPELLNQFVYLIEIAMGDQRPQDYAMTVSRLAESGIVSRSMLVMMCNTLEIQSTVQQALLGHWDKIFSA